MKNENPVYFSSEGFLTLHSRPGEFSGREALPKARILAGRFVIWSSPNTYICADFDNEKRICNCMLLGVWRHIFVPSVEDTANMIFPFLLESRSLKFYPRRLCLIADTIATSFRVYLILPVCVSFESFKDERCINTNLLLSFVSRFRTYLITLRLLAASKLMFYKVYVKCFTYLLTCPWSRCRVFFWNNTSTLYINLRMMR